MVTKAAIVVMMIAGAGVTGCASVKPQAGFPEVQQLASERIGKQVQWTSGRDADRAVAERVNALLAKPLDADGAVQIALLHNRNLQATYE
ncbi:MAG: RND transporter, partial [Tepidisphaeraceae bacterium]